MKLRFLIFLFLFYHPCESYAKECDYPKMVHKMTAEFVRTKGRENQVYLMGAGGSMMDDVEEIDMYFTAYRTMSVESARLLHIDLVESYLNLLHANKKLRPYLHDYPCDFHNVHINTSFEDENHKFQKEGIACVYHKKETGLIYYLMYDYDKQKFVLVHKEPYEEAYKIVKESGALDSKPSETVSKTPQRPLMPFEKKLLDTK